MTISNSDDWRVRPVYGFVEANGQAQLEVQRLEGGAAGEDRLKILYTSATPELNNPKDLFRHRQAAITGHVLLVIRANWNVIFCLLIFCADEEW